MGSNSEGNMPLKILSLILLVLNIVWLSKLMEICTTYNQNTIKIEQNIWRFVDTECFGLPTKRY